MLATLQAKNNSLQAMDGPPDAS